MQLTIKRNCHGQELRRDGKVKVLLSIGIAIIR